MTVTPRIPKYLRKCPKGHSVFFQYWRDDSNMGRCGEDLYWCKNCNETVKIILGEAPL